MLVSLIRTTGKILFRVSGQFATPLSQIYFKSRNLLRKIYTVTLRLGRDDIALYFDSAFYLAEHADVREAGLDPYRHFCAFGWYEGRKYRVFDYAWYLATYPDVRVAGKNAYEHYLEFGIAEGRSARYITSNFDCDGSGVSDYTKWLREHRALLDSASLTSAETTSGPLISVVMATYNTPELFLREAVESVLAQSYQSWELCICDDASPNERVFEALREFAATDPRIKLHRREVNGHISAATNDALSLARGTFVAFLDHDDVLARDALSAVASLVGASADLDIVYSDEDKLDERGGRYSPYFKPDFNYELLLAQNYFNHLTVIRRERIIEAGGLREGYEGAQDHDLILRVLENSRPDRIGHIPRVLYHWRAVSGSTALAGSEKAYAIATGRAAVQDHLDRIGMPANVEKAPEGCGHYRVKYQLISPLPKVTIVIPTRDRAEILSVCLNSLFTRTSYRNFDVIVVDNGSTERATSDLLARQPSELVSIIRIDEPFNFSRLNNIARESARGEILCFMNNDIEVKSGDWMAEMLSFAQLPEVGCVGARLWYPNMTLQHGGVVLGIGGVAGHAHKNLTYNSHGYFCRAVHHQNFSAVTGACLMISGSKFDKVGGFDERLAVAFNDVDFCLRVKTAGYRNVWTPYAELVHHESASRGLDITPERRARFEGEVNFMIKRWGDQLIDDPAYNPNLSLIFEDFSYAWPPRIRCEGAN